MIRQDREHSTRRECVTEPRERCLEFVDLAVHRNAECLKDPGVVRRPGRGPERSLDCGDELVAALKGRFGTHGDQDARELSGATLLAEVEEDICKLVFFQSVEQLRCRGIAFRAPCHAHVQRGPAPKGKSPAVVVDLVRGDAQIQQRACQRAIREVGRLTRGGKVRPCELNPVSEALEPLTSRRECIRIPVHADQPDLRSRFQDGFRVAPASERRIEEPAAALGAQVGQDLADHYGRVVRGRVQHGGSKGIPRWG